MLILSHWHRSPSSPLCYSLPSRIQDSCQHQNSKVGIPGTEFHRSSAVEILLLEFRCRSSAVGIPLLEFRCGNSAVGIPPLEFRCWNSAVGIPLFEFPRWSCAVGNPLLTPLLPSSRTLSTKLSGTSMTSSDVATSKILIPESLRATTQPHLQWAGKV